MSISLLIYKFLDPRLGYAKGQNLVPQIMIAFLAWWPATANAGLPQT
jgi:hypothetical protein